MRRRMALPFRLLMAMTLALSALHLPSAQALPCSGPRVLVIGAADESMVLAVVNDLTATCRFADVAGFSALTSTPALTTLMDYDAVLAFTYYTPADATALGNVLSEYANIGHRVVIATHGFEHGGSWNTGIYGQIYTGNYMPFTTSPDSLNDGPKVLGADLPASPVLVGVKTFVGPATSPRQVVDVAPGATLVAHWVDSALTPLVATKGNIVGLNFLPVSDTFPLYGYDADSDGAILIANALTNSAFATELSVNARSAVRRGTRALIWGVLSSDGATCVAASSIDVAAGSIVKHVRTDVSGMYATRVKVLRKTQVVVSFTGNADCGSSQATDVIRVR